MPGARNPKEARFSLNVTQDIDRRVARLADVAGMNKGTMAALSLSAGLNLLERVYLLGIEPYSEQAIQDASRRLADDVEEAKGQTQV